MTRSRSTPIPALDDWTLVLADFLTQASADIVQTDEHDVVREWRHHAVECVDCPHFLAVSDLHARVRTGRSLHLTVHPPCVPPAFFLACSDIEELLALTPAELNAYVVLRDGGIIHPHAIGALKAASE